MSKFEGFGSKVRDWFRGLESDNSKEYFAAHREFCAESIRDQVEALLTELCNDFSGEIKCFVGTRRVARPARGGEHDATASTMNFRAHHGPNP